MINNIVVLENFLKRKYNLIFINKNTDEIEYFYLFLIEYLAQQYQTEIKIGSNGVDNNENGDLFVVNNKLTIFNNPAKKVIDKLIINNEQKIIFVNYKDFKNLRSQFNCINSFNFKIDLKYFIKDYLKISNDLLFNTILNTPIFISSEINKYFINSKNYDVNYPTSQINKIEELRKKIYHSKDNNFILFKLIKEEVIMKKFSFLTS